jgi:hypothetical protein
VTEDKCVGGFGVGTGNLKEKDEGRHSCKLEDNIKIGVKNFDIFTWLMWLWTRIRWGLLTKR